MPDYNACRHGDIKRVLGAELRDFQTAVAHVDHLLVYALHLIAHHGGETLEAPCVGSIFMEHRAALTLFHGAYLVAHPVELLHGIRGLFEIPPVHTVLRPERRLVNLGHRRLRGDAAEPYALYAEGIAAAEHGTHVVQRPYIVEHHDERHLATLLEVLHRHAVHLDSLQLSHFQKPSDYNNS